MSAKPDTAVIARCMAGFAQCPALYLARIIAIYPAIGNIHLLIIIVNKSFVHCYSQKFALDKGVEN